MQEVVRKVTSIAGELSLIKDDVITSNLLVRNTVEQAAVSVRSSQTEVSQFSDTLTAATARLRATDDSIHVLCNEVSSSKLIYAQVTNFPPY